LEAIEVTTPEPTGARVLLKTAYRGVCHSDLCFQDGYYDLGGGKRLSLKDRRRSRRRADRVRRRSPAKGVFQRSGRRFA